MDDLGDKSSPAQRGPFSTPIQGPYLKPIDNVLLKAGLTIDVTSQALFLETRLMLVAAGFGITALPAFSSTFATTPGIVGRPFSPSLKLTTSAAWPKSGLTASAQRFLDIARSLA